MTAEVRARAAEVPAPSKWRTQLAILISIASLIFSGVSLYETVLKQPQLTLSPGHNWTYERSPTATDDTFIVPLTIANWGARGGIVDSVEFVLTKSGNGGAAGEQQKVFDGNYVKVGPDPKDLHLFAPFSIGGHQSISYSIVFNQSNSTADPLVTGPGLYHVQLRFLTSAGGGGGASTTVLAGRGLQVDCSFKLDEFNETQAIPGVHEAGAGGRPNPFGQGIKIRVKCGSSGKL